MRKTKHVVMFSTGLSSAKRPRMYDYGFSHANCGGRCVKAGIKHYELLFKVWPERVRNTYKLNLSEIPNS